jgi:transcriptional regulator with XRE-family HTH domain
MDLLRDRRKQLRQRLKEARLAAGLRQVDVADALGRPQSYVAKIESGERKVDFVEVLDLCAVIGLDPTVLAQELRR